MKHQTTNLGILGGAVIALVSSQYAIAADTQITNVRLNQTADGVQVVLQTANGQESAQIVTGSNGNALIADINNARLALPGGNSFQQNNPFTGIQSISVTQNTPNSVRLIVNGSGSIPSGEILRTDGSAIGFNFSPTVANAPVQSSEVLNAGTNPLPNFTTLGLPPGNGSQTVASPTVQVPPLGNNSNLHACGWTSPFFHSSQWRQLRR
ncbi:MAG: AMIN domain-containing protein [Coleofasciculaceae cyanobacterium SM2_1_6]|nr:AMIN domain-containing protein [Coleofasciculaceae cyanobacterium SM2_1_6]